MDERIEASVNRLAARTIAPPVESVIARRRRQLVVRTVASTVALAATLTVAAVVVAAPTPDTPAGANQSRPTAADYAAGHWEKVSPPPFSPCREVAYAQTADGLAAVQARGDGCVGAAALYNARSNRWMAIEPPPSAIRPGPPRLAWSEAGLLAMANEGGQAYMWTRTSGSWRALPVTPVKLGPPVAIADENGSWIALGNTGKMAVLVEGNWQWRPSLPVNRGWELERAALQTVRGSLIASVLQEFAPSVGSLQIESSVLELSGATWRVIGRSRFEVGHLSAKLPQVPVGVVPLGDGLVVVGTDCAGACPYAPAVQLARISSDGSISSFDLPRGSRSLAAAPDGDLLASLQPGVRHGTRLYDVLTNSWLEGPELSVPDGSTMYGHLGSNGLGGQPAWCGGLIGSESGFVALAATTAKDGAGRPAPPMGWILRPQK